MATFGLAMSGVAVTSSLSSEPVAVYATLEDDLGGTPAQSNQGNDISGALRDQKVSEDDQSVANWI